jgi:hypothetical protein
MKKTKQTTSVDSEEYTILLKLVLLIIFVSIAAYYIVNANRSVTAQDVTSFLEKQGYSEIQVGEKHNDWGYGYCSRNDVTRFDFTAMGPDGQFHDNMCVCVGGTGSQPTILQLTIRQK